MNILIIGSGGREHAITWKVSQSELVNTIYVAPGNAGTTQEKHAQNIDLDVTDHAQLIAFCKEQAIQLVIVGPEAPLTDGVVDVLNNANIPCFGPSAEAAQLEGSKSFAKEFLQKHQIPTAAYQVFTRLEPAINYINNQTYPLVIKADGLAAGKGVIIAENEEAAKETLVDIFDHKKFGAAGSKVVIEEFLDGEEASFICIADGNNAFPLATSQDHKARDDGDEGPNTGGMGAYSPAPIIDDELFKKINDKIIQPTMQGMKNDNMPFVGFLYAGLMIKNGEPYVLEFNVRLGDPETQPIMMRLESDLVQLCQNALNKTLTNDQIKWKSQASLGVVLASKGYPEKYEAGKTIDGLDSLSSANDIKVFHAGTKLNTNQQLITSGGRVLCVCALGDSIKNAKAKAYSACKQIDFDGMFHRNDIGNKAI